MHGRKSGLPSSKKPVYLLQTGLVARSGRLLPTLTTIVAGLFFPTVFKKIIFIPSKLKIPFVKILIEVLAN